MEALAAEVMVPGSVFAFLAEHRERLLPDSMMEDLFPSGRGRPSVPAPVIGSVLVLQALQGLSDRETAKRRRALGSTVLDDAAARQDTITQLIAGIRRFGREVPGGKELLTASRGRSVELHPEHALMREHRAAARDEGDKPITHATGASPR